MGVRGWSEEDIADVVAEGSTGTAIDNTNGKNDPATVYGEHGEYVIINDNTGEVVQISDRNDSGWLGDPRIIWED